MAKKKRKKRYNKKNNNPTKYIIILVILTALILYTTNKIISIEKYANYYQINENTSKYISYQYKENDTIDLNLKVLNNEKFKRSNYYKYSVKNITNNNYEYQVILTPIDINDEDDIYLCVTDDKNNKLTEILKYSELESVENNKIIYSDKINSKEISKQRLRIWSNKSKKRISFKISTIIK